MIFHCGWIVWSVGKKVKRFGIFPLDTVAGYMYSCVVSNWARQMTKAEYRQAKQAIREMYERFEIEADEMLRRMYRLRQQLAAE